MTAQYLPATINLNAVGCPNATTCEGSVALARGGVCGTLKAMRRRRVPAPMIDQSAFAGYRFPPEVIVLAVRWYLRYGLSYRDIEELLAERQIVVDHVSVYRWVQTFTPILIDAARCRRHGGGDRWFVDETYVRVAGRWMYRHRAVDQYGQVIDVLLSDKRDLAAARRFFRQAMYGSTTPVEVNTDLAGIYPAVLDELVLGACHVTDQYANNRVESDHSGLKAWLRPMRGLKRSRSVMTIAAGHALVQNIRRRHDDLAVDSDDRNRVADAFDELMIAI